MVNSADIQSRVAAAGTSARDWRRCGEVLRVDDDKLTCFSQRYAINQWMLPELEPRAI